MSAPYPERLSKEEKRASDAVRSLASPPAEAAYRARLKQEFESGALARAGARAGPSRLPIPIYRRPVLRWAALPVAAAAALLAVSTLNQGPRWELVSSRGEGVAVIDGVPVSIARTADLARLLKPGARLRLPADAELEVAIRGQMVMQVTPGTEVTLPAAAGRWFGRNPHAHVAHGELRITTGAGFRGARLEVGTPEARVEVAGTTLAVICEPKGTCVCVLEGGVMVTARSEGTPVTVGEGRLRFVFNDARPPKTAGIRPKEDVMLREFREQQRTLMEGGRP